MTITIDDITDEDIELYLYSFQLHQFLREGIVLPLRSNTKYNKPYPTAVQPVNSADADLYIAYSMYYEKFYADRIKDGDTIRWQVINKNFDVSRAVPISGLLRDPDTHKVIHNYVESLNDIKKAVYKSYILRVLMFGLFYRANKSIETEKKILLYPFIQHSTNLIVPHIKQVRYGIGTSFEYTVGSEEITILNRREDIIFKIKPLVYSDVCHHRIDVGVYGDLYEYICEHYPNNDYRIDYNELAKYSTRMTRPKKIPIKVGRPTIGEMLSSSDNEAEDELDENFPF